MTESRSINKSFQGKIKVHLAVYYTADKYLKPFAPSTSLGPWGWIRRSLRFFSELSLIPSLHQKNHRPYPLSHLPKIHTEVPLWQTHPCADLFLLLSSTLNLQVLPPFHPPVPLLELPYFHNRASESPNSNNDTFYRLFPRHKKEHIIMNQTACPKVFPSYPLDYIYTCPFFCSWLKTQLSSERPVCLGLQSSLHHHNGVICFH